MGLTVTLAALFNLSAGDALILLSRVTFVACMAILALVAIRDRARVEPRVQLVFVAIAVLSLLTSVWFRVLDIPWTHFVAAALLGGMVLVSLSRIPLVVRAALIGALAAFLVQTRLFEALVALIAACLIVPVAVWRNWAGLRARPAAALGKGVLQLAVPALVGGIVAFAAISLMSHNWSLYQQYDDQPGMVIRPELAPLKAVQLFWDTRFATLLDYAAAPVVSPLADSIDSWRQPLLLQLPGLAAAAAGLLAWVALRPSRAGFFGPAAVYFIVLFGLMALRAVGLPAVPGPQVGQLQITSSCSAGRCAFAPIASDYDDLAYVECPAAPLQRPVQRISQLRVDAAACPRVGIVPVATGLLYTPDDAHFLTPASI